jgi:hypothetical protein
MWTTRMTATTKTARRRRNATRCGSRTQGPRAGPEGDGNVKKIIEMDKGAVTAEDLGKILGIASKGNDSYGRKTLEVVAEQGADTIVIYQDDQSSGFRARPPFFSSRAKLTDWLMRWFCQEGTVSATSFGLAGYLVENREMYGPSPFPGNDAEVVSCLELLHCIPVVEAPEYEGKLEMLCSRHVAWSKHKQALTEALYTEPEARLSDGPSDEWGDDDDDDNDDDEGSADGNEIDLGGELVHLGAGSGA